MIPLHKRPLDPSWITSIRMWADGEGVVAVKPEPWMLARRPVACPHCGFAPMDAEAYAEAGVIVEYAIYCRRCAFALTPSLHPDQQPVDDAL